MNKLGSYKFCIPIIILLIGFVIAIIKNPKLYSLEALMLFSIVFYLACLLDELKTYHDDLRLEKKMTMREKGKQD